MRKNALRKKLLNKTLLAFAIASGLAMPMSAHAATIPTDDNRSETSTTDTSAEATGWDGVTPALPNNPITAEAYGGIADNSKVPLPIPNNVVSADATAYGLSNQASVLLSTGNNNITVTAEGGSATNISTPGMAGGLPVYYTTLANAQAYGLYNEENKELITGDNTIVVEAAGGSANDLKGSNTPSAKAYAYGLFNNDGEMTTGNNTITVTATGGSAASANGGSFAFARAYGLYNFDGQELEDVTAPQYNANRIPQDDGIFGKMTTGDNNIKIVAQGGGDAGSGRAYAYAQAYGLYNSGSLTTDNNIIDITAQGGVASSDATGDSRTEVYAYGLFNTDTSDNVGLTGVHPGTITTLDNTITITAKGGSAGSAGSPAQVSGRTYSFVEASGLYNAVSGTIKTGNNNITITAEGGGAKSSINASEAYVAVNGLFNDGTDNNGTLGTIITADNTITIAAKGGIAYGYASASAYGIHNGGDLGSDAAVIKTGNNIIDITAVGGDSTGSSGVGDSSARAYGIYNNYNGTDTGKNPQIDTGSNNISVRAAGGSANISSIPLPPSQLEDAAAHAYGMYTKYGTITAKGEQIIYTEATAGTGDNAKAYAYALLATGSSAIVLDNAGAQPCEPTRTVQLTGDISAESTASITVKLDNSESFWRPRFQSDLNINNMVMPGIPGAESSNGKFGSGSFALANGGTLDLAWAGNLGLKNGVEPPRRQLFLDGDAINIGDGATFIINSDLKNNDADRVTVSNRLINDPILGINPVLTITGAQYIRVAYDPAMTGTSGTITGKALVLDNNDIVNDPSQQDDFNASGLDYTFDGPLNRIETYNVQIQNENGDSYLTAFDYRTLATPAELGMTAADAQTAQINILRLQSNSLTRRMGELRNDSEEAKNGIWARTWGGKQTSDSSYLRDFDQNYYAMQLGYDWTKRKGNGKYVTGITLEHMQGDANYLRGSGKSKSTLAGAYMAWLGDKGHYFDIIGKIGRMNNNYNLTDLSNQYIESDYKNWAYTLSMEYGYRHKLSEKTFIEPQAELLFGRIQGADYTASNGVRINQKNTNMALARLGVLYGFNFGKDNKNNAYIRGSLLHDFSGDGSIDSSYGGGYRTIKTIGNIGTAFELNLGTNINMSKKSNLYFELTKTFGGNVKTDWQVNAGLRINF